MADDSLVHQLSDDEPPVAAAWCRSIVGERGEIALLLADNFINDTLRRSYDHKGANHQAGTVRNHGDRLFERDRLHDGYPLLCLRLANLQRGRNPQTG